MPRRVIGSRLVGSKETESRLAKNDRTHLFLSPELYLTRILRTDPRLGNGLFCILWLQ